MDQRAESRKESILEAAMSFFSKKGYRNTDVQEIADHLGIGKGTVYRYFPTKEEFFLACCDKAMDTLAEYIHNSISNQKDPLKRLILGMQSYILFFKKHPELVELFVQERSECKTRKYSTYMAHRARRNTDLKEILTELQKQGKVRSLDPEIIIDTITNFLYGIMFTQIFQEDEKTFEEHAKASLQMILYGIFIPEASV